MLIRRDLFVLFILIFLFLQLTGCCYSQPDKLDPLHVVWSVNRQVSSGPISKVYLYSYARNDGRVVVGEVANLSDSVIDPKRRRVYWAQWPGAAIWVGLPKKPAESPEQCVIVKNENAPGMHHVDGLAHDHGRNILYWSEWLGGTNPHRRIRSMNLDTPPSQRKAKLLYSFPADKELASPRQLALDTSVNPPMLYWGVTHGGPEDRKVIVQVGRADRPGEIHNVVMFENHPNNEIPPTGTPSSLLGWNGATGVALAKIGEEKWIFWTDGTADGNRIGAAKLRNPVSIDYSSLRTADVGEARPLSLAVDPEGKRIFVGLGSVSIDKQSKNWIESFALPALNDRQVFQERPTGPDGTSRAVWGIDVGRFQPLE